MREKKILLFDTSITMARAFEMALKNLGYVVRRTMDPEEILIETMIFRPEVIILEKKSLRDELKTEIEKKCRNIIYSAKPGDIDGTEKYIVSRPFESDELTRIVENLFKQNEISKETVKEESETFIDEFIEEDPVIIEKTAVEKTIPDPEFSEKDLGDIEEDIEDFGAIEISSKKEQSLTKKEPSAPMLLDEQFEEKKAEIKENFHEEEQKESILVDDFVKPQQKFQSEISKLSKIEHTEESNTEDEIFSMVMKDLDSFAKSEDVVYNKEYSREQSLEEDENSSAQENIKNKEIDTLLDEISFSSETTIEKIKENETLNENAGTLPETSVQTSTEPENLSGIFDITTELSSLEELLTEKTPEKITEQKTDANEKTDAKSTILEINDLDLFDLDRTKTNINIQIEETENKRLDRLEKILSGAEKQEEEKKKVVAVTREEIRTMIKEELGQIMKEYFWEEASAIVKEAVENKIKELASDE